MRIASFALVAAILLVSCSSGDDKLVSAAQTWVNSRGACVVYLPDDLNFTDATYNGDNGRTTRTLVGLGLLHKAPVKPSRYSPIVNPDEFTFEYTPFAKQVGTPSLFDKRDLHFCVVQINDLKVTGKEAVDASQGPNQFRVEFSGTAAAAPWTKGKLTDAVLKDLYFEGFPGGESMLFDPQNKHLGPVSFALIMHNDPAKGWEVETFTR